MDGRVYTDLFYTGRSFSRNYKNDVQSKGSINYRSYLGKIDCCCNLLSWCIFIFCACIFNWQPVKFWEFAKNFLRLYIFTLIGGAVCYFFGRIHNCPVYRQLLSSKAGTRKTEAKTGYKDCFKSSIWSLRNWTWRELRSSSAPTNRPRGNIIPNENRNIREPNYYADI